MFLCSRSSRPPYYPREADSPPKHVRDREREREREPPRQEHQESKCTHICSRRGQSGWEWKYLGRIKWKLFCCVTGRTLVSVSLQAAQSFYEDWTDRFLVFTVLLSQSSDFCFGVTLMKGKADNLISESDRIIIYFWPFSWTWEQKSWSSRNVNNMTF